MTSEEVSSIENSSEEEGTSIPSDDSITIDSVVNCSIDDSINNVVVPMNSLLGSCSAEVSMDETTLDTSILETSEDKVNVSNSVDEKNSKSVVNSMASSDDDGPMNSVVNTALVLVLLLLLLKTMGVVSIVGVVSPTSPKLDVSSNTIKLEDSKNSTDVRSCPSEEKS